MSSLQQYVIAKNRGLDKFFVSSSSYDKPTWKPLTEASVFHDHVSAHKASIKLAKQSGTYECRVVPLAEMAADQVVTPSHATPAPSKAELDAKEIEQIVDDKLEDVVKEGFQLPDPPPLDGKPADNSTTAADLALPQVIKFQDPASVTSLVPTALSQPPKIKIPASIISSIKQTESKFKKEAMDTEEHDDVRSSFCKTVSGAAEQLCQLLDTNSEDSLKNAQVYFSSLMSPIVHNFSPEVIKFITSGGQRSTLKDLFQEKKALSESNYNYMGDKTYQSYGSWKAACKKLYPTCSFRGDRDIGECIVDDKAVGEWDGVEGSVYK